MPPPEPLEPVDARTLTQTLERLQRASIQAVASTAGYSFEVVEMDVNGLDGRIIRPVPAIGQGEELPVLVAMKATTSIVVDPTKPAFSYQFKDRRHYDALAQRRTIMKAILLVMPAPKAQANWTYVQGGSLVVPTCYWLSLEGAKIASTTKSPTVQIPTANIFDAAALTGIVDKIDRGERL